MFFNSSIAYITGLYQLHCLLGMVWCNPGALYGKWYVLDMDTYTVLIALPVWGDTVIFDCNPSLGSLTSWLAYAIKTLFCNSLTLLHVPSSMSVECVQCKIYSNEILRD